jgi:hypothetical protein
MENIADPVMGYVAVQGPLVGSNPTAPTGLGFPVI